MIALMNFLPYLFLLVPIAVLIVNNLLSTKLSNRIALFLAIAVIIIQLFASVADFLLLAASGQKEIPQAKAHAAGGRSNSFHAG